MNRLHRHIAFALAATASLLVWVRALAADSAQFDLIGPSLAGTVVRGTTALPLTQVPGFQGGDHLTLRPELPGNQSAEYLMVAVFLRGSTNPPPKDWFFKCEAWTRACTEKGLELTVPPGAQQLLIFFAPKTGGDFKSLRSAVQGKPGAFVRAAQQLNQAALDRSRLDQYVADVRQVEATDPAALKEVAPLLARSLAIKVDEKCLDRIPSMQVACLTQSNESLILNDGRETSMVSTLTSGPASDLAFQAGSAAKLDSGAYIPYIGSLFDIARLMDTFHTAHYQYIPALTTRQDQRLVLMLNTPPSFHDPQSVLVATLPAIEPAQRPALHTVDVDRAYCAYQSPLVLAVEGAPLLFSTAYAHELKLNVIGADGTTTSLPARADARRGGLIVDTSALGATDIDESRAASLSGVWGFDSFEGPAFRLAKPQSQSWKLAAGDDALLADQENTLHMQGGSSTCIDDIRIVQQDGRKLGASWKADRNDSIEVKVPLRGVDPGPLSLEVRQFGQPEPQRIAVSAFANAGHLDGFTFHAGDTDGTLRGSRLEQVESMQLKGFGFTPGVPDTDDGAADALPMTANDAQGVDALKAGESLEATVRLKDGRRIPLKVTIGAPRPRGVLIAKNIQRAPANGTSIELADADELPLDATLAFSVRTLAPQTIAKDQQIEVATADGGNSILMSVANSRLTLESRNVAVAKLQPAADFGPSAFGLLQFRLITQGVAGDWQRLALLTRLPVLNSLQCPGATEKSCVLSGSNLFLLDMVANNRKFAGAVRVAEGFPGNSLEVPSPADGKLYIRLRDNPAAVNAANFAMPLPSALAPNPAPAPLPAGTPVPAPAATGTATGAGTGTTAQPSNPAPKVTPQPSPQ